MLIETTPLTGVLILTPARFGDARGFFSESWNKARAVMRAVEEAVRFAQEEDATPRT